MTKNELHELATEAGCEAPRVIALKKRTGAVHLQLYWGPARDRRVLDATSYGTVEELRRAIEMRNAR